MIIYNDVLRKVFEHKNQNRSQEDIREAALKEGIPEEYIERALTQVFTPSAVWDPADDVVNAPLLERRNEDIREKLAFYKKRPYILKLIALAWFILGLGVWAGTAVSYQRYPEKTTEFLFGDPDDSESDGAFYILFIVWAPLGIYLRKVRALQRDLVKKMIADENGWLYNPRKTRGKWMNLEQKFPEIFQKGNTGQCIQDELWGTFHNEDQEIPFYSSIFEYQHKSRGRKSEQRVSTYYKTVFAVKLNKTLENDLTLLSGGVGTRALNFLGASKDAQLESEAFNSLFHVKYSKENEKGEIFKKLSPAVQVNLVDLAKAEGGISVYFKKDVFLFVYDGFLFESKRRGFFSKFFVSLFRMKGVFLGMHTDFLKKVEVDPRDEKFLHEKIQKVLSIATEIPQYLD